MRVDKLRHRDEQSGREIEHARQFARYRRPMPRINPGALAALAITASRVIDVVATVIAVEPSVRTALELVARAAHGESGLQRQLTALDRQLDAMAEAKRRWKTPAEKDYYWAVNAVSVVVRMAATGQDHGALVLTHLSYGLAGGEDPAIRLDVWHAAALAATRGLSAEARPRTIAAATMSAEAKQLARIAALLGRNRALLVTVGARHHPKRIGTRAALTALLKRTRYPVHASVLAFEASFGGLVIPDAGADDDWFETDVATHLGAFACLRGGGHTDPRGGRDDLVPVAFTPNDGIVFLDRAGTAYYQDTVEDPTAKKFTTTGAAAVAKLLRAQLTSS
jgi:hypothetical protein